MLIEETKNMNKKTVSDRKTKRKKTTNLRKLQRNLKLRGIIYDNKTDKFQPYPDTNSVWED